MGEEYEGAKTKLPAGILTGHAVNGLLALATLLSLMAATPSLDVITEAPFGQAHLYLCLSMPGRDISPIGKADSIGITTSIMLLTAGSFGLATASRCIFAGARIGLFPQFANRVLALLYQSKPWPAMVVAMMASLLWALFTFSSYAFNIIAALSTLGLWCSFISTLFAMAVHKLSEKQLPDGGAAFPTFGLPSTIYMQIRFWICLFAIVCAIPLFLILCLPASLDPSTINAESFPWAPMVLLIVSILAAINYFFGFHNYHPEQVGTTHNARNFCTDLGYRPSQGTLSMPQSCKAKTCRSIRTLRKADWTENSRFLFLCKNDGQPVSRGRLHYDSAV